MASSKEVGYALKETIFSDNETRDRLIEIKKDIIKEYINHIRQENPAIEIIEEPIEKYLINDGSIKDIFQDIFRECWLSLLLPESIDNLKRTKEKISSMQRIPTSEELISLKSEVLNISIQAHTNQTSNGQQRITPAQQTTIQPQQTTQINYSTTNQGTSQQRVNHNHTETSLETSEQDNKFIRSVYERVSKQIGKDYKRGGTSPNTGFDCSGLRYWAFKEEGIKFSQRLTAHGFSDADVDLKKDQVKPGDFMFWDQKPGKKKHNPIYHIEMIISKPYTKNGKTYVRTLGSSTDAKDDRGNYVGKGVQIREREMKDYRHYGRPTYYYQLAQYEKNGSNNNLIAGTNKPSHDLESKILSA